MHMIFLSFVIIPITKLIQNKYATIIDAKLHFCFVAFKALPMPVIGCVKCCIVYKCLSIHMHTFYLKLRALKVSLRHLVHQTFSLDLDLLVPSPEYYDYCSVPMMRHQCCQMNRRKWRLWSYREYHRSLGYHSEYRNCC